MKFSTFTKNTAVPALSFIGLFALCSSSCTPEDKKVVCEVVPYADLAFLVADVVEPSVGTAAKLILNSTIENVKKDCRRMAEASNSKTNAFYRADANAAWQQTQFNQNGNLTYDVIVPRPALDNGANDNKKEDYNLTTAGYYKFECSVDKMNKIKESNENDNSKTSNDTQLNKIRNQNDNGFFVNGAPFKKGQTVVVFVQK